MSDNIQGLIDRYIDLNFSIHRKGEVLVREQLGEELTNDQLYILRYISKAKFCTSTELAEHFDVQKSAITAIINRMWEKGIIMRTRDEKDRRVVYLTLTDKGNELYTQAEKRIFKLVESFIEKFDHEEINQFMNTYAKLNQVIINSKANNEED